MPLYYSILCVVLFFSCKSEEKKTQKTTENQTKEVTGPCPKYILDNKKNNLAQKRVDAILEKIAQKGYEGLTKEEKDILFNESKR